MSRDKSKPTFWGVPKETQSAHQCSLIRIFIVCMKKPCILGYLFTVHSEGSDQTAPNVQADLNLPWVHVRKYILQLKYLSDAKGP